MLEKGGWEYMICHPNFTLMINDKLKKIISNIRYIIVSPTHICWYLCMSKTFLYINDYII